MDFKAAKSLSAQFKSDLLAKLLAGLKFNLLIILCGEGEDDKVATATEAGEVVEAAADVAAEAVEVAETSDIIISLVNLAIMSVEELKLIIINQRPKKAEKGQIRPKLKKGKKVE